MIPRQSQIKTLLTILVVLGTTLLTMGVFAVQAANNKATTPANLGDPADVLASKGNCGQTNLSWTAGSGAVSYKIYRNDKNTVPTEAFVNNISATSFVDYVPAAGVKYYYWVQSTRGNGKLVPASTNATGGIAAAKCVVSEISPKPAGVTARSLACGEATIRWSNGVKNEKGYYIYRNRTGNTPVESERIATRGANDRIYKDTVTDGTYYYWVSSFNSAGESGKEMAENIKNRGLQIASCPVALSASDKDLYAINGKIQATTACDSNQFQGLPSSNVLKKGDILTYAINICNTRGKTEASNVIVSDVLTNLDKPATGFNAKSNGNILTFVSGNPKEGQYSYDARAGKLNFNLGSIKKGTNVQLTYDAEVKPTDSYKGSCLRCLNQAEIKYSSKGQQLPPIILNTPYLYFTFSRD